MKYFMRKKNHKMNIKKKPKNGKTLKNKIVFYILIILFIILIIGLFLFSILYIINFKKNKKEE